MEIDYSAITPLPARSTNGWKPPRHVYFGPKDPETGELGSEPVYIHQSFPAMLYKVIDEKMSAVVAKNKAEHDSFAADGWMDTPAAFGKQTAPSYEDVHSLQKSDAIVESPRRGRPPKVEA